MNLKRYIVLYCLLLLGLTGSAAAQATFEEAFGTGLDGSLNVSGAVSLDLHLTSLANDANTGASTLTPSNYSAMTSELQVGDEILILKELADGFFPTSVGAFEFNRIASFNSGTSTVVLENPLSRNYPAESNIYRVPNFSTVTVPAGQTLQLASTGAGSVLAFRANESVNIGGIVTVIGRGYSGGTLGNAGASQFGPGGYTTLANGGGGGGGNPAVVPSGGGGGGHARGGQNGPTQSSQGIPIGGGGGGLTYGVDDFGLLTAGSGGGSGEAGTLFGGSQTSTGGNGGGIIFICTPELTITGTVTAQGVAGQSGFASIIGGTFAGAGGGAGGSIWLQAIEFLGTGAVTVAGGPGGSGGFSGAASSGPGGNGGSGRVRIDTIDGVPANNFNIDSGSTFDGEFDAPPPPPPPNAVGNWLIYQ